MKIGNEQSILSSWQRNVSPWAKAVEEQQIESRRLTTDQAIVSAVTALPGRTVIDIGCGEGWLCRELSQHGFVVTGIDATAGLIDRAKALGAGTYRIMPYGDISDSNMEEKFDIAVCNFSLLGDASVKHVFQVVPKLLQPNGKLVIQTLHPHVSCGDGPYADGWREGSWDGFSEDFVDPAPWYFRTLETWHSLYKNNGMRVDVVEQPVNPKTGKFASLLMVGGVPDSKPS